MESLMAVKQYLGLGFDFI